MAYVSANDNHCKKVLIFNKLIKSLTTLDWTIKLKFQFIFLHYDTYSLIFMKNLDFKKSLSAGIFSLITIGVLTFLTYKTEFGVFLLASFGSSMVLLYGYPESPFAQPKNVFFGHLITAVVGLFFLNFIPLTLFIIIPLAVGFGAGLMILLNVTHPPAGGNPIIVIIGSVSLDYILTPVITGSIIIIIFAIVINRLILKKKYPNQK